MAATATNTTAVENFRSNIAEGLFCIEGKPLSLIHYPMYVPIYDGAFPKLLLKTGRQVAKSTTIACFMIAECVGTGHFKTYYISPSAEQTRKFSHTRIAKILAYSPDLRKYFVGPESIDNVYLRMFRNGAEMAFSYADTDADRVRGFSSDRTCFDVNAEALTRQGWRRVKDITRQDELADVNDADIIEWHHPTRLVRKRHCGAMVQFNHHKMALRVTDNHEMWANYSIKTSPRYKTADQYQFIPAGELARTSRMGFKMTNQARLQATAYGCKEIAGSEGYRVSRESLSIPYQAFADLMGWYIAEGNLVWRTLNGKRQAKAAAGVFTDGYAPKRVAKGICITQSEGAHRKAIERCLKSCGLRYSRVKHPYITSDGPQLRYAYVVNSAQLGAYCEPLGKCRDKYIPEEFFKHPVLLEGLLKSLHAGDATARDGTLRTRSRQLADDVHRAWTLLGRASVIHTRMMPPREGAPPEPLYEVQALKRDYAIFWRSEFQTKQRVVIEPGVDEDVFCFTLPNHRPIIRGGFGQRPVITGQCFDEVQDILFEPVIPVVEECMAASEYQYSIYCGTPKTMENSIEFLWSLSSQTEWCMRCDGCGKLTFIDSIKFLGKYGPECAGCRKPLNPRNGRWIDMKPGQRIKGFHISQQIMPMNVPAAWAPGTKEHTKAIEHWDNMLFKLENWGEVKFLNECVGVSTSTGARLLTKDILEGLCDENLSMTRLPNPDSLDGILRVVAGVDWSGGGGEVKGMEGLLKSRTVLHLWGEQADGRLRTLYYKIYPNSHPVGWIDDIVEVCNAWNVCQICGDAGEGALANSILRDKLGAHRVLQVRYMALSKPIDWNPNTMTYNVDRTTLIDNYALFLTHGQVVFPKLSQAAPAIADILNVFEQTTKAGRKIWNHAPTQPDDALHSQIFAWLALRVMKQDLKFYV